MYLVEQQHPESYLNINQNKIMITILSLTNLAFLLFLTLWFIPAMCYEIKSLKCKNIQEFSFLNSSLLSLWYFISTLIAIVFTPVYAGLIAGFLIGALSEDAKKLRTIKIDAYCCIFTNILTAICFIILIL